MSGTVGAIHERKQAAARALYGQEDYVRRLGHLSDEELSQQLVAELRREKVTVSRWIDSGDCFVLSGAGKVHRPECPSMRQFMDRDAAWEPYLADLERVRDWHGSDNAPDMPKFMTRASVERMGTYKTCPVCAPTLDHKDKRPGVRGWSS